MRLVRRAISVANAIGILPINQLIPGTCERFVSRIEKNHRRWMIFFIQNAIFCRIRILSVSINSFYKEHLSDVIPNLMLDNYKWDSFLYIPYILLHDTSPAQLRKNPSHQNSIDIMYSESIRLFTSNPPSRRGTAPCETCLVIRHWNPRNRIKYSPTWWTIRILEAAARA